jgi:beta-phosphoglucomutase-like phosphatase (HAD superfamily)
MIGFSDVFDTVVCADDVGSSKPNPASYLTALSNLGVVAAQAFALEDSPNGVQGAKNAGLFCVAVPGPMTKDQSFDHADMRLESLADMPLAEILGAIS